jgi:protein tyrosine phosphatase
LFFSLSDNIPRTTQYISRGTKSKDFVIDEENLKIEFKYLTMYIDKDQKHQSELLEQNKELDRYKDIRCFKNNYISIGDERKYINASYIGVIFKANYFITTQAPKDKTINDFWGMVYQEKAKVVVMLCNLEEGGKKKCANYLPPENNQNVQNIQNNQNVQTIQNNQIIQNNQNNQNNQIIQNNQNNQNNQIIQNNQNNQNNQIIQNNQNVQNIQNNQSNQNVQNIQNNQSNQNVQNIQNIQNEIKIKVNQIYIEKYEDYDIRTLKLELNNDKRTITHLHYKKWPDKGVPDINSFITFEEIIKKVDQKNKEKDDNEKENEFHPIVVHCSAGVGRTGTFISMFCLYKEIKMAQIDNGNGNIIQFNILNLVRKMKEMRLYMVQTFEQYKFIYQFAKYLLDKYN